MTSTSKKRLTSLLIVTAATWSLVAGCDRPPFPPKDAEGNIVKVLSVSPAEREELEAATTTEAAKVNYQYRLQVLKAYYEGTGNMDKLIWARRELKNLQQAWVFGWEGLPEITPPTGESVEDVDEHLLVEYVVVARKEYLDAVAKLVDFYSKAGRDFETSLIQNVQARLDPVRLYVYYFAAELPPAGAKPVAVIPQAEMLFAEALDLHEKGKGILRFAVTTSYPKQRQALAKFRELIAKYPTSNKIAEGCYYIGDIYKEYFNENVRAVRWYQRAWELDPNITKPARFQAATVYDLRLQDKSKAVECYRLTVKHEQLNASNVSYSLQRIAELTGQEPSAE